jgi:hypothetical protein
MSTGIYSRAADLASTIELQVHSTIELASVLVTLDGLRVANAARTGCVVVLPPRVELPTFSQYETEWQVLIVAGPVDRLDAAWQRLDQIMAAVLATGLPFERAEPDTYQTAAGARLPCIALTFTEIIHPEQEQIA